ncbi:MAG: KpsF/GutQ family sugar-phosphate isomerase [Fimbriimonadaceae bacterium]|nr:KpsF/GutQ family sugar-phosphate isomerase [Fimbriimonadaceae bacterium]
MEAEAIRSLSESLSTNYETAAIWMFECKGRVITCGVGKSGHIARKTAGTLSSTGTPSLFLHATEAMHGDLGMVTEQDILLLYSHSGETDEITSLFPSFQKLGARTILITGRIDSTAGRSADLVLDTRVVEEACPNNLAPTTSTTVMLAVSDALAVAVMEMRGFQREDFARFHPAGALGKRLLLTVADVMRSGEDNAIIGQEESILDVLRSMTRAGAGAVCVIENTGKMVGIISDGDIRRHFLASANPMGAIASEIMSVKYTSIPPDLLAVDALESFQNNPKKIGEMPVLGPGGEPLGMIALKDLLRSGIV